ncbi:MAG TPA: hypothetical protein PKK43_00165 [Spirochaetota bacterium]|nr:hypothetical protein [Spirochaetota bacterium]
MVNSIKQTGKSGGMKVALRLTLVLSVLMIAGSILGLIPGVSYAGENEWGRTVFQGNDIVNMVVYLPLLLLSRRAARSGNPAGELFFVSMTAACTYSYFYYPFALKYGVFFILYVALFGLSLFSFLFSVTSITPDTYSRFIPSRTHRIAGASLLFVFAGILAAMWIGMAVVFILTGKMFQEGGQLISVSDIVFIVTPLSLSGYWLLRGDAKGFMFGIIMSITCALYCLILIAYTPLALVRSMPDAFTMLPFWIICFVAGASAFVLLIRGAIRPEERHRA